MALNIQIKNLDVNVHIDVYSAQTGVSRFLELNRDSGWIYDKTENLPNSSDGYSNFTHLLVEAGSESDATLVPFKFTHQILAFIEGYDGLTMNKFNNIPIKLPTVRLTPKVFILKKILK